MRTIGADRRFACVLAVAALALALAACGSSGGGAQVQACTSPGQAVSIPDQNLLAAVRGALGKPTGAITCGDLGGLKTLTAENAGIASLEGLQHAKDLEWLWLTFNDVRDLSPLANLE